MYIKTLRAFPQPHDRNAKIDMASSSTMKLSLTFVLLSGLVVLGEIGGATAATCAIQCFQGGYITCKNYPGKQLDGCDCQCAPKDGKDCVLHLYSGSSYNCTATK